MPVDDDPWGAAGDVVGPTPITKSWTESFLRPDDAGRSPDEPDGPDYWFTAEVDDVDFDIHFRLGKSEDGELVITGMLLGSPGGTQAITTSNLHRLPLGSIYQAITAIDDITTSLGEKARDFHGNIPSRGGQRSSHLDFITAAQQYKHCAIDRPNDTIKCVAERLGVSSATASRRVQRARDMRMLRASDEVLEKMAELVAAMDTAHTEGDGGVHYELGTELWNLEQAIGIPTNMRKGLPF
jgi:hypothetical protein